MPPELPAPALKARRGLPRVLLLGLLCLAGLAWSFDPWRPTSGETWVRARVQALGLTPAERRWEEIGWINDLGLALQRSRETRRPIFLLLGAGHIDGRC